MRDPGKRKLGGVGVGGGGEERLDLLLLLFRVLIIY